jgi:hypothetical protein
MEIEYFFEVFVRAVLDSTRGGGAGIVDEYVRWPKLLPDGLQDFVWCAWFA